MSKRSNGEGNIRQRPNGSWEARISYVDEATGKRKRVSFYGRTKTEVRDKLKAATDRIDSGAPPKDATVTVASWLAHWRATTLRASDRKDTTKELYAGLSRTHLEPDPFGSTRLDRLRPSSIEALVVDLQEKGRSDSTIRSVYTVLRQALDVAVRDGLLASNPATKVKRPSVTVKEATFLDLPDVGKLLEAAEDSRYSPALRLIASTGLRAGEAVGLRWSDVDLDEGVLRVRNTVSRLKGRLELTEPKTARSRRSVPLSAAAVAMLRKHRASLAADRLAAGDQWRDEDLVFPTEFGTPVDPRNLRRVVEVAARKAGLDGVGVHTLRHSAAVAWLEAGVHIRAVADLLGHSSISITGDIYGHTSDATARSAVDGLSSALGF